eukprot:g8766.t1
MLSDYHPMKMSLLKLNDDCRRRSRNISINIKEYMESKRKRGDNSDDIKAAAARKILCEGLNEPKLKDEIYMQLIKQTRGKETWWTFNDAWELFYIVTSTMSPSEAFLPFVTEYIHMAAHGNTDKPIVKELALKCKKAIKRSPQATAKNTVPSTANIIRLKNSLTYSCIVFFLDDTFEEITYKKTTTVSQAVKQLADIIGLKNYETFTLFVSKRVIGESDDDDTLNTHSLLESDRKIYSILDCFGQIQGVERKLLLKKKRIDETDEMISEPQFVSLCYMQSQYEYLFGKYPVVSRDAVQLCVFQIVIDYGLRYLPEEADQLLKLVQKHIPKQTFKYYSSQDWVQWMTSMFGVYNGISKENARFQFLRIIRNYQMVLGINKNGFHFFTPSPREYIKSIELREIIEIGSNEDDAFFRIRVNGTQHVLKFATKNGKRICVEFQIQIRETLEKIDAKAKLTRTGTLGEVSESVVNSQRNTNKMHKVTGESVHENNNRDDSRMANEQDLQPQEKDQFIDRNDGLWKRVQKNFNKLMDGLRSNYLPTYLGGIESHLVINIIRPRQVPKSAAPENMSIEEKIRQKDSEILELEGKISNTEDQNYTKGESLDKVRMKIIEHEGFLTSVKQDKERMKMVSNKLNHMQSWTMENELFGEPGIKSVQTKRILAIHELPYDLEMEKYKEKETHDFETKCKEQESKIKELEHRHQEVHYLKKKCSSMLRELKGKIKTMVRLMSLDPHQEASEFGIVDRDTIGYLKTGMRDDQEEFILGEVFDFDKSTVEIFESIKGAPEKSLEGYNISVVSCGMEKTGKTTTLFGTDFKSGLIYLCLKEFFRLCHRSCYSKWETSANLSMLELFEEHLTDLLSTDKKKLIIKQDRKGLVHVVNSQFVQVESLEAFCEGIKIGLERQICLGHDKSAAHLFVFVNIKCSNNAKGIFRCGRMMFSDLVGFNHERSSFGAFSDVVEALDECERKIPYTNSTLTKLLNDSIGGNSLTNVIVHIHPLHCVWEDVKKVLEIAKSLQDIKNPITKNEIDRRVLGVKHDLDRMKLNLGIPRDYIEAVDMVDITDEAPDLKLAKLAECHPIYTSGD